MTSNDLHQLAYFSLVPENSHAREVTADPSNSFIAYKRKENDDFFSLSIGPAIRPKGGSTIADVGRTGDVTIRAPHISRIQCSFEIAAKSESEMGYILVQDHSTKKNTHFIGETARDYVDGQERKVLIRPGCNEVICFGNPEGECHQFRFIWHREQAELRCNLAHLAATISQSETTAPLRRSTRIRVPNGALNMRFSALSNLGEGAYGTVDLVAGVDCGSRMALKQLREERSDVLDPQFPVCLERFKREFETLAKLEHPHILKLVHYQPTPDGQSYQMFTEVKEGSMLDLIKKGIYETESHIMDFLKQMLSALDFLEVNGIIHRDVKPENILYTTDGTNPDNIRYRYALADFNLVNEVIKAQTTVGTPGFASPELLKEPVQTAKMDVWGLFVTLAYAANKPASFRADLNRILKTVGSLGSSSEASLELVREAAKDPYWKDLRGMAEPNPLSRKSAGDMLDTLFNGEGRAERHKGNIERPRRKGNKQLSTTEWERSRRRRKIEARRKQFNSKGARSENDISA